MMGISSENCNLLDFKILIHYTVGEVTYTNLIKDLILTSSHFKPLAEWQQHFYAPGEIAAI